MNEKKGLHLFLELNSADRSGYCDAATPFDISGEIPFPLLTEFLSKEREGIGCLHLSGGEPVLYGHFYQLLSFLEKQAFPYSIYSFGCWPEPSRLIDAVRSSSTFLGFTFHLHDVEQCSTTTLHSPLSPSALYGALGMASENGLPFQIMTEIRAHNRKKIKELIALSIGKGAFQHLFSRYVGPIREGFTINRSDLRKILAYIRAVGQAGLPVQSMSCFPRCFYPESSDCRAGEGFAVINHMGTVKPCRFTCYQYGSIYSSSLKELMTGGSAHEWKMIRSPRCNSCTTSEGCRGGCPVYINDYQMYCDPLMYSDNYAREQH